MTEEEKLAIRNAKNAYLSEWRRRNPEKVKAAQERYWLKRAEEIARKGERSING